MYLVGSSGHYWLQDSHRTRIFGGHVGVSLSEVMAFMDEVFVAKASEDPWHK
jgi:hypothetical protein